MNNLKYFRTLTDLEPKELSALLGVSVYTYRAYENDRMIMDEIIIKLICRLFNVEKEELFIEKDKVRQETINRLIYYSNFNKNFTAFMLVYYRIFWHIIQMFFCSGGLWAQKHM